MSVQNEMEFSYPLITVAIVTYNHQEFVREALDSVLAQHYPNLEIVVADDASTDETLKIVDEIAANGGPVWKVVRAPHNRGITANHNAALRECTGDYIAWLGGDDLMLPGKLHKQVALMEADPDCAICYHDLDVFHSATGRSLRRYSDVDTPRQGGIAMLARYGAINGGSSNMVRRSCSPTHFDLRINAASDWLYYVQCLASGGQIRYLDDILGRYRRHDDNITSGTAKNPHLSQVQDHLFSCDLILTAHPHLFRQINHRRAFLFRGLRWANGGVRYTQYLRAALSYAALPKTYVGYLAAWVGIKR